MYLAAIGRGEYNGYIVPLLQGATGVSIHHNKGPRIISTLIKVCSFFSLVGDFMLRNRTLLAVSLAVCAAFTGIGMVIPFPVPISEWLAGRSLGTQTHDDSQLSCAGNALSGLPGD